MCMLSLFVVSRESELARVHELSCIDYNLFFFEVLLNGIAIVSVLSTEQTPWQDCFINCVTTVPTSWFSLRRLTKVHKLQEDSGTTVAITVRLIAVVFEVLRKL